MSRPVLEVHVGGQRSAGIDSLIRQLGRRWARVEARVVGAAPAARLVATWWPLAVQRALDDAEVPVVLWIDDPEDVDRLHLGRRRPDVVVGPSSSVDRVEQALPYPVDGIDASTWRVASPFVRRRRRALHGLPDHVVVEAGGPSGLDGELAAAGLAVASAVVAVGPWSLAALALGAPTVTDERTATWLGATEEHVVVAAPADHRASAEQLAADDRRAARLSWAGRRLVLDRWDVATAADRVATALELGRTAPGVAGVRALLTSLQTPTHSIPAERAAARLAGLGPHTQELVNRWTW